MSDRKVLKRMDLRARKGQALGDHHEEGEGEGGLRWLSNVNHGNQALLPHWWTHALGQVAAKFGISNHFIKKTW